MTDFTHALVCLFLTVVLTGLLWMLRRQVQGTTLLAPWTWALVAVWTITFVEWLPLLSGAAWTAGQREAWRFVASTGALCPGIAVMGAKRPQDRAWKFIVGSLWGVLALPAAKVLVLRAASSLTLHPAQSWFLLALVVLGVLNWLPTRLGIASVLAGAGLVWRLSGYLPLMPAAGGRVAVLAGLSCFVVAASWVVWRSRSGLPIGDDPRTRLWREFRDLFGAFWSLRLAERWNAVAAQREWPRLLAWRGFYQLAPVAAEGVAPAEEAEASAGEEVDEGDRTFHSLLRRFVDRDWIARRSGLKAEQISGHGDDEGGPA